MSSFTVTFKKRTMNQALNATKYKYQTKLFFESGCRVRTGGVRLLLMNISAIFILDATVFSIPSEMVANQDMGASLQFYNTNYFVFQQRFSRHNYSHNCVYICFYLIGLAATETSLSTKLFT